MSDFYKIHDSSSFATTLSSSFFKCKECLRTGSTYPFEHETLCHTPERERKLLVEKAVDAAWEFNRKEWK